MATEISLKRGTGKPASLNLAEPAVDIEGKVLYIGTEYENSELITISDDSIIEEKTKKLIYYSDENVTNSISIGENAIAMFDGSSIAIGHSSAVYEDGIGIGYDSSAGLGIALGHNTSSEGGVALGNNSVAYNSIQIGEGKNEEDNTLKIYDYKLLDSEGKIPIERLPIIEGDLEYKGNIDSVNEITEPKKGDVYTILKDEEISIELSHDNDEEEYHRFSVTEAENGDKILTVENVFYPYTDLYDVKSIEIGGELSGGRLTVTNFAITEDNIEITISSEEYDNLFGVVDEEGNIEWYDNSFFIFDMNISMQVYQGDMVLYDGVTWLKLGSSSKDVEELIYDSEILQDGIYHISIGQNKGGDFSGISIGNGSQVDGYGVAIGCDAQAQDGIAIGLGAETDSGIQIGFGNNHGDGILKIYSNVLLDNDANIPLERLSLLDSKFEKNLQYNGMLKSISGIDSPSQRCVYCSTIDEVLNQDLKDDSPRMFTAITLDNGNKNITFKNPFGFYMGLYEYSNFVIDTYNHMTSKEWKLNIFDYDYEMNQDEISIEIPKEEYDQFFIDYDGNVLSTWEISYVKVNLIIPIYVGDMIFYDGTTWLKINSNNKDKNKIIELEQKINNLESLIAELSAKIDAHG